MINSIFLLGRQPDLGLAELESKYGVEKIAKFSENVATSSETAGFFQLKNLGGTIKLAEFIGETPKCSWPELEDYVTRNILPKLVDLPEGKIDFGISCYGLNVLPKQIMAFALGIKKSVRAEGRSIRIVPNQTPELSSAQILHNHLDGPTGFELVICVSKDSVIMGRTTDIQDIEAYAQRDQARPKRDAKVGMLPPKLAQIMINLANPSPGARILDPFCGTGVILQEALLMGHSVIGTDNNLRMIEFTKANLSWLQDGFGKLPDWHVAEGDATTRMWIGRIDVVVSEAYLGKPLFKLPSLPELEYEARNVSLLIEKFLVNLDGQVKSGTKVCIAVPAWFLGNDYLHLPILDHLEKIGYNHMSFKTVDTNALIYHRPQQIVARQLLVLIRK